MNVENTEIYKHDMADVAWLCGDLSGQKNMGLMSDKMFKQSQQLEKTSLRKSKRQKFSIHEILLDKYLITFCKLNKIQIYKSNLLYHKILFPLLNSHNRLLLQFVCIYIQCPSTRFVIPDCINRNQIRNTVLLILQLLDGNI